ncbi:Eco57I restriction-modification methylase domain-containing protein [Lacticaseibacillus rhamnosus]|uniref:Eco57I restriction-modification methylase domain-containing protein n=1 Tax=Lacticaseibacillus rhamnosus TaxID=47715 RepID=UPI001EE6FCE6|nr:Eco57I restriction-modification methylase domain-containing protein [Lacticaseibacillus rhamnosus]
MIKPILDQGILSELQASAATEPESAQLSFATTNFNFEEMSRITRVLTILAAQYTIVVTNPPYMGSGKMTPSLSKFVKREYPDSKADLFAVFMELTQELNVEDGYHALITQHQWMFLSSFEKLRVKLRKNALINMAHLGTHAFEEIGGEVVQSTAFVMRNVAISNYVGTYERLVTAPSQTAKEAVYLEMVSDPSHRNLYRTNQTNFGKIPGSPIAYWASQQLIRDFETGRPLSKFVDPRQGLATADNNRFLRQWFEVAYSSIKFDARSIEESISSRKKWFPYNKGGAYRKWYGNYDYVVNWENDGREIRKFKDNNGKVRSYPRNTDYYFREAITWSDITSGSFAARYRLPGSIHDVTGMSIFFNRAKSNIHEILAALNSRVANEIFSMINPTMHLQIGNVTNFPVLEVGAEKDVKMKELVNSSITQSRAEWNSFETSWDFLLHPILRYIAEHTVLVICHIHRRISKIRVTAKHPFKKLATWWHKIQNVPKKCQTFGLGGH